MSSFQYQKYNFQKEKENLKQQKDASTTKSHKKNLELTMKSKESNQKR